MANPNSNRSTTDVLVRRLRRSMTAFRPDVGIPNVLGVTATTGPPMITTPRALAEAARHIPEVVGTAIDRHRCDVVVIGGFGDPGVDRLRDCLTIPVIGIGEAALRDAGRGGHRFGIATTTGDLVEQLTQLVHKNALTDLFTSVEVTKTEPMRLAGLPELSCRELAEAVERALAGGAAKVIIGGGPLSSSADHLEQLFPGVIVDPICAAARWAMQLTQPELLHNQWGEG
jgi:allantoin racemase